MYNDGQAKQKYYCLDMFPYPSGNGLHVGHWRGYVISDVWSRYQIACRDITSFIRWAGMHSVFRQRTMQSRWVYIRQYPPQQILQISRRQINEIAAIYDWDMEVNTTDPNFYKWTQWIFVQMFKKGLAYEKEFPINWCPSCKTGLANEEVVNG